MTETGFSLVEMLFVVLIMSVVLGMTLPNVGETWDEFAVRGAADQFISAHQKTRTAAVRYGAVAELHLNTSTGRFWVQVDTSVNRSGVMDTMGAVIDVSEFDVDLTSTGSLLCFDIRGLVANQAGCPMTGALEVGFSRNDATDTVSVTASGLLLRR